MAGTTARTTAGAARRRAPRRALAAAGVLVALGAVAACSGGGSGGSSDSAVGEMGVAQAAGGSSASDSTGGAPGLTGDGAVGARRTAVQEKAVIRTAEVTLTTKHLARVRADVDDLMAALGGRVDSEETSNDRKGRPDTSTLVLRVPVDRFDAARKALAGMGKQRSSHLSGEDVTTQVIDVEERVQTLQNSLDDLQRFQRRATDVRDLLAFEDKIAERQAELQSLQAQQTYLRDQTSMATITVHLSVPEKYVPPPDALDDAGFLSGLVAGWHALRDLVVVLLTVLGAVLPFAVVGLLLGVPAWWALRRLVRRRRAAEPAPEPAA